MVYNFADVCIVISPTVKATLQKMKIRSKLVEIGNPINEEKWHTTLIKHNEGRALLGLSKTDFVVLGVGQMQQRKGIEDFIDLAIALPHLKFVWVGGRPFGKFTEGIHRIDDRIKNAPNNIQFTGLIDLQKMPEMYSMANVFVFTSYQENCPLAPIEAAAAGLPVIFRNLAEYKTLYNCKYISANNTTEFTNAIVLLHANKTNYLSALQISKQLVLQFDKNMIHTKLIHLYQSVLDGTNPI
jgi:1,2-diacylglycerol-3-alpha-glucose alpha-1,2-galactosyltransferase